MYRFNISEKLNIEKSKLRISTVLLLSRPFGSFSEPFKAFRSGREYLDMIEA